MQHQNKYDVSYYFSLVLQWIKESNLIILLFSPPHLKFMHVLMHNSNHHEDISTGNVKFLCPSKESNSLHRESLIPNACGEYVG